VWLGLDELYRGGTIRLKVGTAAAHLACLLHSGVCSRELLTISHWLSHLGQLYRLCMLVQLYCKLIERHVGSDVGLDVPWPTQAVTQQC
jgi:hypothetical protein